ncbi:threonine--tRNA ligase [Candidatus Woesearchaeota archaeon]|nr:threonine--tRNA ligase [Candidatus Woesearchaeota archaeon]
MIKIKFPDGSHKEFKKGITPKEIVDGIGPRLAKDALIAQVDDKLVDLSHKIMKSCQLKILTSKDPQGLDAFRHSSAHLLAQAVTELYPETEPTIGPVVEEGFYYDFDRDEPFRPEDIKKIEEKMNEIIKRDIPLERLELTKAEALKMFKDNKYKKELIHEFGEPLSAYKQGDFADLCRGPHVPSTGKLKAVKVTKIAGAYWRGDAKNKMLQRVYGISFASKDEMKDHLKMIEEAEKRDHRKIGKELELFSFSEMAPGFPFFHDKGTFIFGQLTDFMLEEMRKRHYEINKTPLILNKQLWLQSGHWDHYKENMYFTKIDETENAVKPMNCPGNLLVYKTKIHSYRELPLKAGEFGLVHRHELSGVLSGLFRVRAFTQDDAHIFCEEEQLQESILELIELCDHVYRTFGFQYEVELSTKPEKAMGSKEIWDKAEGALKQALETKKMKFKINEGDGAFYGPKIDFHLKDAIGRRWQCGTIQVDFSMPEKFDLTYEGKDGQKHRPVMVHRAIYGSFERFIGILVEHYAGKFPLWLSPNQVAVLTVADRHNEYADKVYEELFNAGLRAEKDYRKESIPKKVRDNQLRQFNYILVVGDKEAENKTVNVRTRDNVVHGEKKTEVLLKELLKEISGRGNPSP